MKSPTSRVMLSRQSGTVCPRVSTPEGPARDVGPNLYRLEISRPIVTLISLAEYKRIDLIKYHLETLQNIYIIKEYL